jgi:hypothetical protein
MFILAGFVIRKMFIPAGFEKKNQTAGAWIPSRLSSSNSSQPVGVFY